MTIGLIIFIVAVVIYVASAVAVVIWDQKVRNTDEVSWVDSLQIFFPIYNTVIAWSIWSNHNPYKSRD